MQTKDAADRKSEVKIIGIDANKTIASIGLKMSRGNHEELRGIKLGSDEYEEICSAIWDKNEPDGIWKYQEVPRGQ